MTLIAHKLVDCLLGKSKEAKITVTPGTPDGTSERIGREISQAEKFEFVNVPFEPVIGQESKGVWALPHFTEAEAEAWHLGLIPLPAPLCWYEFQLHTDKAGLLIRELSNGLWYIERIDWLPSHGIMIDNMYCEISTRDFKLRGPSKILVGGNESLMSLFPSDEEKLLYFGSSQTLLSVYLTLMLLSRTTYRTLATSPDKLNKAREKRKLSPLYNHTIVDIVPDKFRHLSLTEGQTHHASPRLHWRRSHIRTIHKDLPQERKILIARMLVGRAELGEISHEYRVR